MFIKRFWTAFISNDFLVKIHKLDRKGFLTRDAVDILIRHECDKKKLKKSSDRLG